MPKGPGFLLDLFQACGKQRLHPVNDIVRGRGDMARWSSHFFLPCLAFPTI